jgi:hypothetical protein
MEFFCSHLSQFLVSFNNSFTRSLTINSPGNNSAKKSLLKILERLVDGGYLKNNRHLVVKFNWSCSSRFIRDICSMKNLEKLSLWDCELALEQLAQLFWSCPKLVELSLKPFLCTRLGMDKKLKNHLRPGFQKLRRLELNDCRIYMNSWPVIQEMLT